MQKSALNFYGSSFITDQTGELVAEADRKDGTGDPCNVRLKSKMDRTETAFQWGNLPGREDRSDVTGDIM